MQPDPAHAPHRHFNYSNVMSTLAVFLVIAGGTALAAALPKNSVNSKTVDDNSLKSKDLKDGKAVGGADVIAEQVQLRVGGSCPEGQAIRVINVQGGVICEVDDQGASGGGPPSGAAAGDLTGSYPNPTIANDAVNSAKVADGSLTGADVADNTLGGADVNESSLGQVPSALLGGFGRTGAITSCDPESTTHVPCAGTEILHVPSGARALVFGRASSDNDFDAGDGLGNCRLSTSSIGEVPNSGQLFEADDEIGDRDNTTLVAVTPPLPVGATSFGIECNEIEGGIRYLVVSASAVLISDN